MKIGNVYYTRGICELIEERVINIRDIIKALDSFSMCDYGSLCESDVKFQNDYFKKYGDIGDLIIGVYFSNNTKFWLTNQDTEMGRTTTVLLPEEY